MLYRYPFPRLPVPKWAQLAALRDFVRGASPGDAFVFFCTLLPLFIFFLLITTPSDAGHSGQQPATIDPNEVDGLDECLSNLIILPAPQTLMSCLDIVIVTCDFKIILDNVSLALVVCRLSDAERL